MSIKKQYLKGKSVCKVTFRVPKSVASGAETICLVGEFNEWDTAATPMRGLKSGEFTVSLNLNSGREYQFRYLIDGVRWANDEEEDSSAPSSFPDAENSVLVV